MEKSNLINAQRVTQNNQEYLLSVIKVSALLRYTKYTELIITEFDENNYPVYNKEIQRRSDPTKVKLIANYLIFDPQAMFPTNIVLAIPSFVIDAFLEEDGIITLILSPKVEEELTKDNGDVYISVIDGQHRLRGIELAIIELRNQIAIAKEQQGDPKKIEALNKTLESLLNFEVAVTFFIDPVLEYQASIFSTINRTQTKVSESLVYSLFGLTDKVSPQKSSLEIALSLNSVKSSPFYNRVKLVGWTYKRGESPPLTQAAMVKSIIRCICANVKESEMDRFRPRADLKKGITPELCFRRYYANNEDVNISKILFSYYDAVKSAFFDKNGISFWDFSSTPNLLQTTVGYEVFLNLLKLILKNIDDRIVKKEKVEDDKYKLDTYKPYLSLIGDFDFTNFEKYPKASVSKSLLYQDLKELIFPSPQNLLNFDEA